MTDKPKPTLDERIAEHQAREEDLRRSLAELQFDGPFDFPSRGGFGDLLGMFGSVARNRFAICLRCGSMVVLNDPEETGDGTQIERGVRLHLDWHEEVAR